jgi:hypothetical protein
MLDNLYMKRMNIQTPPIKARDEVRIAEVMFVVCVVGGDLQDSDV